jgi:SAM-dependent methyltransferase
MNNSITPNHQALHATYDRAFYAAQVEGSERSAAAVVPKILALFPWVRSVLDVGCGTGTWLNQFHLLGVPRIYGIDGGNPVGDLLQIEMDNFRLTDLSQPFSLTERFDLVTSFEVAEHLPASSAKDFVSSLCKLGDAVVFAAAIPGQGGTQHINERWPSYWIAHFKAQGFVCFDVLRGDLWYDERVEWWYRQNVMVFVKQDRTDVVTKLQAIQNECRSPIDLVHPICFAAYRKTDVPLKQNAELAKFQNTSGPVDQNIELSILRNRLETIENSTSWRAISALNRLLEPYPGLRKFIRRAAKIIWWTVTLQLFRKISERASTKGRGG